MDEVSSEETYEDSEFSFEDRVYNFYLTVKKYCEENSLPIFNHINTLEIIYEALDKGII